MAAPCLQLYHLGLEAHHPADVGAPFGQLLGGLLKQLYKSLMNNYVLQDSVYKNKSASMERGGRLTSTSHWATLADAMSLQEIVPSTS